MIFISIISSIVFFGMTFYITDYYTSLPYMILIAFFFLMGFIGIIGLVAYNWLIKSDFVIDYFDTAYK